MYMQEPHHFKTMLHNYIMYIGTSSWTLTGVAKGIHTVTIEAKCPNGGKEIQRTFKFEVD